MTSPPKDNEETPVDVEVVPDTEVLSGDENKENVEASVPEMTFADYKLQQDQVRSKVQHNIRKANEGEKKETKGLKELKKETEEEQEEDGSLFFPKKYYEEKYKTSGRVKEHMNLNFQFATGENRHFDGERGGRRGGRGGRGRGGRGGRGGDRGGDRGDRGDRDIREQRDNSAGGRDGSPVVGESAGFGSNTGSGLRASPTDDKAIQLEDDQEFPTLG